MKHNQTALKKVQIAVGCGSFIALSSLCLHTGTAYGSQNLPLTPTPGRILTPTLTSQSTPTASIVAVTPAHSISVSSSPDYLSDGLQAVYVFLTLVIAAATIWSIRVNRKQSQAALIESQKQSKAALDRASEQIEKGEKQATAALAESHRQSQDAIKAIHEQIEASEKQNLETTYNQSRPLLVCIGVPNPEHMPNGLILGNFGLGIATDIIGIVTYKSSNTGWSQQYLFRHQSVLAPNQKDTFYFDHGALTFNLLKIEGFSFFPEDKDTSYNIRLVVTYHDIFNRKHLSVFDGRPLDRWKQITLRSGVKESLDDLFRSVDPFVKEDSESTGESENTASHNLQPDHK